MIRKKTRAKAEISTASLPDIVFLLLFFFMVSATIKPMNDQVKLTTPKAEAMTKVNRKELIREIIIGKPINREVGDQEVISVDNRVIKKEQLTQWVMEQKETLPENLKDQMIIVIKADEYVKMGLVDDVQEELKKANARKVVYRTTPKL
ncbi:ExbD/TolR family protein [Marinoscillum pacificum]|uniref:ExbD/TolR family protein n=1 Tax=Marinoscillum pacificum TaxID=392723 RepID=UPI0021572567|nr:biopolymer transporter ExbD [Marinoscillum pacificum]